MHESGDVAFIAEVEAMLTWEHREQAIHNNVGKKTGPEGVVQIRHAGNW